MERADLLIDGMLSGTGIRDVNNGGYISPQDLGLPPSLLQQLSDWHARYENAHFEGFSPATVALLDDEGLSLSRSVANVLTDANVGYYSHGLLQRLA